ncbi:MAG: CNP1-like family protein [Gammaproteobacteria bacterium]|nr:CNP1-like family protein [Gammaproteobacteria bacterium]MBU2477547.1 CNP1-like family protein [Gammaproteobacteria bacterium]
MPAAIVPEVAVIRSLNTKNPLIRFGLLLIGLWFCQAPLVVAEESGPEFNFVEGPAWKEQDVVLPAYPDGRQYVEVPLQLAGSDLRMFIQEPSLAVGADGVTRYVLMLRSPSGTENLFYEGIRCTKKEWRSYAYGTSAGEWQALGDTPWQPIRDLGVERYRMTLYRYYLCDPISGPLSPRKALDRIRYGAPGTRE